MPFHFYGTGTGHVGRLQQPDGSYHTTEWVIVFFVPLIPLRSVRVVSEAPALVGVPFVYASRRVLVQQRPFDWAHVGRVYMVVIPLVLAVGYLLTRGAAHHSPSTRVSEVAGPFGFMSPASRLIASAMF